MIRAALLSSLRAATAVSTWSAVALVVWRVPARETFPAPPFRLMVALPALTTIEQKTDVAGALLVEKLMQLIDGGRSMDLPNAVALERETVAGLFGMGHAIRAEPDLVAPLCETAVPVLVTLNALRLLRWRG